MRSTIISISGWFLDILLAMAFSSVVFPALGGATIKPLCPLPIGAIRSINLVDKPWELISKLILSFGKIGVRSSKFGLLVAESGLSPLIFFT
jgi:hypothetical protein